MVNILILNVEVGSGLNLSYKMTLGIKISSNIFDLLTKVEKKF